MTEIWLYNTYLNLLKVNVRLISKMACKAGISTIPLKALSDQVCIRYAWFCSSKLFTFNSRAPVVHLNFRAVSTFPVLVCTVPHGHWVNKADNRTSRCNKVDVVRLYASYRLNLLLLKGQSCVNCGLSGKLTCAFLANRNQLRNSHKYF